MGIQGLHSQVASWGRRRALEDYRGQRAAVDASSWLFKGCYTCARDLALGVPTLAYLNFFVQRTALLRSAGIHVTVVFDGRRSPMKVATADLRSAKQAAELRRGKDYASLADAALSRGDNPQAEVLGKQASDCFGRAIKVTDDMVSTCILAVQELSGVDVVVAPYEADAQLAMLVFDGVADVVVTEDSDVLVYAALCADASGRSVDVPLLLKLDAAGGVTELRWGVQLEGAAVTLRVPGEDGDGGAASPSPDADDALEPSRFLKALKFFNGPNGGRLFLQACVLAGCDYSRSLPGIGIVAAATLVHKFKTFPDDARLDCIVRFLHRGAQAKVKKRGKDAAGLKVEDIPEDYADQLRRAEAAFLHHPVFVVKDAKASMSHGVGAESEPRSLQATSCEHLSMALKRGLERKVHCILEGDAEAGAATVGLTSTRAGIDSLETEARAFSLMDALHSASDPGRGSMEDVSPELRSAAGTLIDSSSAVDVARGALDPTTLQPRAPLALGLDHPTYRHGKRRAKKIVTPRQSSRFAAKLADAAVGSQSLAAMWAPAAQRFPERRGTVSVAEACQTIGERRPRSGDDGEKPRSKEEARKVAAEGCRAAMSELSQVFSRRPTGNGRSGPSSGDTMDGAGGQGNGTEEDGTAKGANMALRTGQRNPFAKAAVSERRISTSTVVKKTRALRGDRATVAKAEMISGRAPLDTTDATSRSRKRELGAAIAAVLDTKKRKGEREASTGKTQLRLVDLFGGKR